MLALSVWVCISLVPITIFTGYNVVANHPSTVEARQQSTIRILETEIKRLNEELKDHQWDRFFLIYHKRMLATTTQARKVYNKRV